MRRGGFRRSRRLVFVWYESNNYCWINSCTALLMSIGKKHKQSGQDGERIRLSCAVEEAMIGVGANLDTAPPGPDYFLLMFRTRDEKDGEVMVEDGSECH